MHQVSDRAISMQIGEVAKLTTLTVDAIRFYERRALLPKAPRTVGRFRLRVLMRRSGAFQAEVSAYSLGFRANRLAPRTPYFLAVFSLLVPRKQSKWAVTRTSSNPRSLK